MFDHFRNEFFILLLCVLPIENAVRMLLEPTAAEAVVTIQTIHAVEHVLAVPHEHPADVLIILLQIAAVVLHLAVITEIAVPTVTALLADETMAAILGMLKRETVGAVATLQELITRRSLRLDNLSKTVRNTQMELEDILLNSG